MKFDKHFDKQKPPPSLLVWMAVEHVNYAQGNYPDLLSGFLTCFFLLIVFTFIVLNIRNYSRIKNDCSDDPGSRLA